MKAIRLYPKLVDAHARLGTAHSMLGDEEAAAAEWRKAHELLQSD